MTDQQRPLSSERLHATLEGILWERGTMTAEELVRAARDSSGELGPRLHHLDSVADASVVIVLRPDGRVSHLSDVLDGIVLTHRATGRLAGRRDLWLGPGVQPLLTLASVRPLALAGGGCVELGRTGDDVLVGPPGWLPDVGRGELVALRWVARQLHVAPVATADLAGPEEDEFVRSLTARLTDHERWYADDERSARAMALVQGLTRARLADPDLLSTAHLPLDELLHDPLDVNPADLFREHAAFKQCESVSYVIDGMPVALERELRERSKHYGMTQHQFVIALLGHLAWRTPFAEDIAPWEAWCPPRPSRTLRSVPEPVPDPPA